MICDIVSAPQRSAEWFMARCGRLTGSVADAVLAGKTTAARVDLVTRLVVEQLTGNPQESGFINDAMQWGMDHEDEARIAYEMNRGVQVSETGFLSHPELMLGCSLDGHLGNFDGIVEIKCPFKTARHLKADKGIPTEYLPQLAHNLWLSGSAWCDFVSYDPRLPEKGRLMVHRLMATDHRLMKLDYERQALALLDEVTNDVLAYRTKWDLEGQLAASLEAAYE